MSNYRFPFAVRLIGFSEEEADLFDITFANEQGKGYGYFRLADDNLQDPDLYVVNADELKALVTLSDLTPSEVRPALLVGTPSVPMPYPRVERPLGWYKVFDALDTLVEKRAEALARLDAAAIVKVPERRRRDRLDLDLTDPGEYQRMRGRAPAKGGVLIVDKNTVFRNYVAKLLSRYQMEVTWTSGEEEAVDLCNQNHVSVVMLNTSTPTIDPYRLCQAIKTRNTPETTTVMFLVGRGFVYDSALGQYVGADGFLNKPLASHHLISVLKKFLPM